ncbi:MAG: oxidoreductase [Polyangiaceae bacterium]
MAKWTERDIADQSGKVAVVTGANSGLGRETAHVLVERGATVVLACRDVEKGKAVASSFSSNKGEATVLPLDLSSLASVARFSDELGRRFERVDLLVNNAGIMALPRTLTVDGFESQLGTNHLGHFALTARLLPMLRAASAARVVTVSSTTHWFGKIRFDDLMGERRYDRWSAYAQSKLANLLFTLELARRFEQRGERIIAAAAHPGYAGTNLQARASTIVGSSLGQWFWRAANAGFAQSPRMGAMPTLHAATAPTVGQADYFGPRRIFELYGYPERAWRSPAARDRTTAAELWRVSEKLVGLELPE